MSEVISFRLDRDNPREAQALAVLCKGQAAGYSLRHILTEALLALEAAAEGEQAAAAALQQMAEELRQVRAELARLQSGVATPAGEEPGGGHAGAALSEDFLASVRRVSKAGMKME